MKMKTRMSIYQEHCSIASVEALLCWTFVSSETFRLSYFRIVKVTLTYPLVLSSLIFQWKMLLVSFSSFDICSCACTQPG